MDEHELFPKGSRFPHGFVVSDVPAEGEAVRGLCAGDDFGEYHLARELHQGRSVSVFEAVEGFASQRFALKALRDLSAAPAGSVAALRLEAEVAARLRHPSLQKILGMGEVDGTPYYLMTLHSGVNAESFLGEDEARLDPGGLVELAARFASVVDAVAALHRSGIVHRDINPANILLDAEGRFILSDFGSALNRAERNLHPEVEPAGELMYRCPQRLLPGSNHYSPAGDIYSLGLTLYSLLAGRHPFPELEEEELGKLKLRREPPALNRLNPLVPPGLGSIVRQACEPRGCYRYESAEDMARELKRFVSRRRRGGYAS
tara:strand:+ start:1152 stop:2105 length:954 start_codon:yes stop_codon:yes gene_type:complete